MNKGVKKLFFFNSCIIFVCLFILGLILELSSLEFVIVIFIGAVMALILDWIMTRVYLKPLLEIQNAAQQIRQGEFKGRISLGRKDELGELAQHLQFMSIDLQNKIKEITQDKNELKAILSSMVEGVIVIGKDERVILMNSPVYTMLDLRSRDIIGKPYWEVIRNEEINSLLKEAMAEKKSLRREITIISLQESQFSMQVSCIISDSGNLSAVVAVFHDITEMKKLARLRSEFVANVSHELKTPLTSIKGFVETLKDGALKDKEKAQKFLDIIQRHTHRLENLVNDILSLSSIETREITLNLEKTSLNSIIEPVIHLCKDQIESRQHKIIVNIPEGLPSVFIDPPKMEQVFLNLLDNAIKFTPPGGIITIKAVKENEYIRINVQDSGIGIGSEHLDRIFERFYRVDKGRSRDLGGTGLGLAIVKHLVQVHKGKVSVESELQKGSLFSVFLPIQHSR